MGLGREQQRQRPRSQKKIHRFRVTERPVWHGGWKAATKVRLPCMYSRAQGDCRLVR